VDGLDKYRNAHLGYILGSPDLLWIKFLKLKIEYGFYNIFIHTPAISPVNMCLEWMDGAG